MKLGKMSQNLSSAAVVIGTLRVNSWVFSSADDFLQIVWTLIRTDKMFDGYSDSVPERIF